MTTGVDESLAARWAWWHAEREEKLRQPHGWLSLTGLHWLTDEPQEFPGVPGSWRVSEGRAEVTATTADGLAVHGRRLSGTDGMTVPDDGATTFAEFGDIAVEVIMRSGRYAIRVRDPHSPLRQGFTGVPTFPVSADWVITAHLDRYPVPRDVRIDTAQQDLTGVESAVGDVRFTAGGTEHSLVAFAADDGITVLFTDATSGRSTAAWRALWVEVAPEETTVRLDFNRAVNLPSAFSDYGTCPKPPAGNELSIAVEAGEQNPAGPLG
ncbi:MAG TPA: DUF1684 domain-containing protein [Pseudonocardiaceae bacterium]